MNREFRGHTVWQWLLFGAAAFVAFSLGVVVPPCWQLANIPIGLLSGLLVLGSVLVLLYTSKRASKNADSYQLSLRQMV